jgi:hypothetical protein
MDMPPEQIHELGLREVARIRTEMLRVKEQVGFSGDLDAFFKHLEKREGIPNPFHGMKPPTISTRRSPKAFDAADCNRILLIESGSRRLISSVLAMSAREAMPTSQRHQLLAAGRFTSAPATAGKRRSG